MPNGWRVVGQRGTSDIVAGRLVDVMEVTVQTDDGTERSFKVPEALYTKENVEAQVNAWYEQHQAIAGL